LGDGGGCKWHALRLPEGSSAGNDGSARLSGETMLKTTGACSNFKGEVLSLNGQG